MRGIQFFVVMVFVVVLAGSLMGSPGRTDADAVIVLSEGDSARFIGGGCPSTNCQCQEEPCDINIDPSCPPYSNTCSRGEDGTCYQLNTINQHTCTLMTPQNFTCAEATQSYCGGIARNTPGPGEECDLAPCNAGTFDRCGDVLRSCADSSM